MKSNFQQRPQNDANNFYVKTFGLRLIYSNLFMIIESNQNSDLKTAQLRPRTPPRKIVKW
jgi:hypothetical protein